MAGNRSRNIHVHVRVNERERSLIEQKMGLAGIRNMNTYMRKMAIDGHIIRLDMSDIKELVQLVRRIGNNVNQIAKRANETRHLYAEDMADIRRGQSDIWATLDKLLAIWDKL